MARKTEPKAAESAPKTVAAAAEPPKEQPAEAPKETPKERPAEAPKKADAQDETTPHVEACRELLYGFLPSI